MKKITTRTEGWGSLAGVVHSYVWKRRLASLGHYVLAGRVRNCYQISGEQAPWLRWLISFCYVRSIRISSYFFKQRMQEGTCGLRQLCVHFPWSQEEIKYEPEERIPVRERFCFLLQTVLSDTAYHCQELTEEIGNCQVDFLGALVRICASAQAAAGGIEPSASTTTLNIKVNSTTLNFADPLFIYLNTSMMLCRPKALHKGRTFL